MWPFSDTRSSSCISTIIAHLGTGGVRVGLVVDTGDSVPQLAWSLYLALPVDESVEPKKLERTLLKTAEIALSHLQADGLQYLRKEYPEASVPQKIICVLGPAWYTSHARVVSFTQQKSFLVTDTLIHRLSEDAATKLSESEGHAVLEEGFSQVKINGYPTVSPIGKRGRTLDIVCHFSCVDKNFKDKIQDIAARIFHTECPVEIHSQNFVSFAAIRTAYPDTLDYMVSSVGAELTELAVVRDDTLVATSTIPLGSRTIARQMAGTSGRSVESALGMLRRIAREALQSWKKEYDSAREALSKNGPLPVTHYVVAEDRYAEALASVLNSETSAAIALHPADMYPLAIDKTGKKPDTLFLIIAGFSGLSR